MPLNPAKSKHTVFIVDDHPLVREWLTNLIYQQSDLTVCGEAVDVPGAKLKIGGLKPDLAVVDISLKESSGIELIKELKVACPTVAVLVLSMHEGALYVERALHAGANGYVTKRESATTIIEAIRRVLAGEFYLSEDTGKLLAARLVTGKGRVSPASIEQFSQREREVFELLSQGKSAIQIAEQLQIDSKTVHTYCARMREKLQLRNTAELLREAFYWQVDQESSYKNV